MSHLVFYDWQIFVTTPMWTLW